MSGYQCEVKFSKNTIVYLYVEMSRIYSIGRQLAALKFQPNIKPSTCEKESYEKYFPFSSKDVIFNDV